MGTVTGTLGSCYDEKFAVTASNDSEYKPTGHVPVGSLSKSMQETDIIEFLEEPNRYHLSKQHIMAAYYE